MLYYEFKLKGEKPFKVPSPRTKDYEEWINTVRNNIEDQNRKQDQKVRFFVVEAKSTYLKVFGFIGYKNNKDPKELAIEFARGIGFNAVEADGAEIKIHTFGQLARQADRNGFIDDDDRILNAGAIGDYSACQSSSYTEFLVEDEYKITTAKNAAKKVSCGKSFLEEIDRIYTNQKQKTFIGNPVHYIMYCDDWDTTQNIANILISSLYSNGRLKSKRVALMQPRTTRKRESMDFLGEHAATLDMDLVENLFTSQKGGAFVIKPGKPTNDGYLAKDEDFQIEKLASLINENKLETLSITVLGKAEKDLATQLKLNAPNVRFVEISEQPIFSKEAIGIIKEKASSDGIDEIDSLVEKFSNEDKAYFISDINTIYNEWLSERLPSEVYPQYSEIKKVDASIVTTKGSAYTKLQTLVGLDSAKGIIQQALDYHKAQALYKRAGLKTMNPSRHMVFTGNPGTAKTTVARLFAQIMKDNGVLDKGDLIEVGRNDLVGKYVGWTAKLVEEAFCKAQGSVLFIDEAYSLCEGERGLFGEEAINAIVQMMENKRSNTVVIFAGYPDRMEEFLDKNPGLRSRIAFNVHFDDYDNNELVEIFKLMANENEMLLAEGVEDKISKLFEEARKNSDFGNGRYARNVFEQARMKQASRLVSMSEEELTEQAIRTLTVEDFSTAPVATTKQESRVLGFVC